MLKLVINTPSINDAGVTCQLHSSKETQEQFDHSTEQQQVIYTLEKLLIKAQAGHLNGLMYVTSLDNLDHGVGVTGKYLSQPDTGLSAFCLVYHLLGERLQQTLTPPGAVPQSTPYK